LEDVDAKEWDIGCRAHGQARALPELRDVASDQQNNGLVAVLTIDRDTASRLGILSADIDNTSTMLTPAARLHDLHAIESVSRRSGSGSAIPAAP